jgi:peptide/nickel transport system substrate-binding protein
MSRRCVLASAGSASLGAVLLAACGGDSNDNQQPGSNLIIQPKDETSTAKRGGTSNIVGDASAASFEQLLSVSGSGGLLASKVYNQLTRMKMGTYNDVPQGEVEGEFAESFEVSPDGLTATYKVRPQKFDRRPPTNGRMATSADVKYSWDRFEAAGSRRQDLSNKVTTDAPILGVETPDARTAVMKLAFPFAPLHSYFGSQFYPLMYPIEAQNEGFDTRAIGRGTGAYTFQDGAERAGTNTTLQRNPDYWDTERPYFDNLRYFHITDYSAIVAQFKSGAIDYHNAILQEDVLQLKTDVPQLQMYQRPFFAKGVGGIYFGRRPDSPWNDDRVRKALSMSLDRKLWGDIYSNRVQFEAAGLPVDVKWMAGAGPGYDWSLDPEKNELGPQSKNLHHSTDEAHKLLVATGKQLPIRSTWQTFPGTTTTGASNPLNVGMFGILEAGGDFKFDTKVHDSSPTWTTLVRYTGGDFDGISLGFYFDHHDYDFTIFFKYHPASPDFWMRIAGEDPKMTDFVNRQRRELDPKKRAQILQDFLKYDIDKMYYVPYLPADFKPFYLAQPWVGGWGWWQPYIEQNPSGPGQTQDSYWFDASKKTT